MGMALRDTSDLGKKETPNSGVPSVPAFVGLVSGRGATALPPSALSRLLLFGIKDASVTSLPGPAAGPRECGPGSAEPGSHEI